MKKTFYLSLLIIIVLVSSLSLNAAAFSREHANFSVVYKDLKIPLKTFSIFVMPRENIKISISDEDQDQSYTIELGGKIYESSTSFNWKAHAESGHYQATIREKNKAESGSEIKINVFVLHPYENKNGQYLEDFRIGYYPEIPADKKEMYSKPKGFLKIDQSLLELNLTPHFKMKQFLTGQSSDLPQFIAIQESLILKLEFFLEEVNKAGYLLKALEL